ncbi:UNVERIFIED_ORG: RND family efflux transporter MFP subunit [Zoogloea ramigera]|uniref:Efflux RND transporter periplasmic adaptor subunit n=1 Tax=Duganella zoogloeoides TaxID=75659 RepID=A0ABZ0XVI1_9BURK|nr:efflux RND transporter periplasmic adaptor subunit [Duganella zoogloeoides]WQH03155.1 efflux RND transporter periplasmic adaptor subunit [Duganella zoogloeoides]
MLRKTLLAIAVATALAGCNKSDEEAKKKEAAAKAANITLQVASEDTLVVQSSGLASGPVITGSIQPERRADLRAEVSAIVLQVLKENGEPVKKGDVLLRLDETSIRDNVNSAEEAARAAQQSLDQTQRMLERQTTLRSSGMVSSQALEDVELRRNTAQSELAAAKSRLVTARQQLGRTVVRAPFDGIVSERKVSNGDTAQVGKELVKVIDPASMRFEGTVSADKIGVVKVGQPVLFRVNGYPGQNFAGTVKRVDPAANAVTRQVEVLVSFAGPAQPRVAGLYAEGRIEAQVNAALTVPQAALVQAGDVNYVWRVKNGVMNKAMLGIGTRDERTGNWQVLSGLAAGDTIMRVPGSNFKDGLKVAFIAPKVAKPAQAVASAPAATVADKKE